MSRFLAVMATVVLLVQPVVEPDMVGVGDNREILMFLDSSYSGDVIIPEEHDGGIVTEVYIDINRNITSVSLPKTVKAFHASSCSATAYYVDADNPYLCSVDGVIYSKHMDRLVRYPQGRKDRRYDVADTVKIIDKNAFCCAKELVAVNLPDGLKKIESYAFAETEIPTFCLPESLEFIDYEAFSDNRCLETITIPKNVSVINNAFLNCDYLESIILESINAIDNNEFGVYNTWSFDPLSFVYNGCDEPVVYLPDESYDEFMEKYIRAFGTAHSIKRVSEYSAPERIRGDVNGDRRLTIADLVMFQRWLMGNCKINFNSWKCADLCEDDRLDMFDLLELRRLFLKNVTGLGQGTPVSVLEPTMPCIGRSRVPVFVVDFPDYPFYSNNTADTVKKKCFGEENKNDKSYPLESIPAYFERASYGKLYLECDVINYTAKNPAECYVKNNAQDLVEEIMTAFEDKMNYSIYDINADDIMDSMIIVVPESLASVGGDGGKIPDWWPFSAKYYGSNNYGGLKVGTYCVSPFWEKERAGTNAKIAHELCHAMGLTDYYCLNKDNDLGDGGMYGDAGVELMDEGKGDLSAFSKLMLGWISDDDVQVYTGGEQTFTLNSSQQKPSCIVIPRKKESGWLSEYFIIEFITGEFNNTIFDWNGNRSSVIPKKGGVRIFHCDAEISENVFGMEMKYSITNSQYDISDEKQRVLRLVNHGGMFYPGTRGLNYKNIIDSSVEGFAWYDENGDMTVDTGLQVQISDFHFGPDYTPNPFSDLDPWSGSEDYLVKDPAYLNGGTYTITILPSEN